LSANKKGCDYAWFSPFLNLHFEQGEECTHRDNFPGGFTHLRFDLDIAIGAVRNCLGNKMISLRPYWLKYFVMSLMVGSALFLSLQIDLLSYRASFSFFFAAVMVSTWYGGKYPGIAAIILSALAAEYFIVPPIHSFRLDAAGAIELATFLTVASLNIWLTTAMQQREAAIRESEEKLLTMFGECPVAVVIHRWNDRTFVNINAEFTKLTGWTREEVLGRTTADLKLVDDEDASPLRAQLEKGLSLTDEEVKIRTCDGQLRYVIMGTVLVDMRNGRHAITTFVDITARKNADEGLRRSEEQLAGVINSAMDAIITIDSDQCVVLFNAAAEKMFGCAADEAFGASIERFIPQRFRSAHSTHIEHFGRTNVTRRTMSLPGTIFGLRNDGEEFPIEASISQLVTDGQKFYTVILRDITERKQLEEQFRQSQKLEAIGHLAGGIAHDFNNLLTVINGYGDLALRKLKEDDPARDNIREIRVAGDRAAGLTGQLLAFSRKQVLQPIVLNLNVVIEGLEKMLRRIIRESIIFRITLDPNLGNVKADLGQIEQILMNLAVNARDAMMKGGTLTIETQNVFLDEDYVSQHLEIVPGPFVRVTITDTGDGMDEQTRLRIFEPFFTTKERGKGTGLGLSTVYGIVKQSGGDIMVYSELNHGTTFKIYFPRVDEDIMPYTRGQLENADNSGTETILLVEDEDMVRNLAGSILTSYGYKVMAAASGSEAIEIVNAYDNTIHLLLTDVIMPGMGGSELRKNMIRQRPGIKVLFMSGYTDDTVGHSGVLEAGCAFIEKPFTPDSLARKVREVLNADPPRVLKS
jgi:PAS domain S-box-containing protein